ncbi:MAG: hypothetical protein A2977_03255 [Alphaproteobacteria bacterium RIFCSPLOWO2_01_FULL_45_8]|nr:MAG: hypothetical protein A2065_01250 [Alphaproteobacteria bacterium GWB1_45_5]OFW76240.1 MAG: hypothetical protein A3K20_01790 [Alphaproteobacteria bacterium GWA1_45_9]OFW89488.1 MAG: hypothetical protein A2621_01000 [Alphaproteobacteria bacterium RIFCSPHIGHO2_01_FULL_41_14]OFW96507.1 MAG: hypothetical protein A2977_03255 [Alphaproteobacteria bacterium RIFCSPLOWO2_01_FULL_45_8]HCI48857.1 hypothetical protein [Holosporales bacterium]
MTLFRLIFLIFIFLPTLGSYSSLLSVRTADHTEKAIRIVFDVSEQEDVSYKLDLRTLSVTLNSAPSAPFTIKNQSNYIRFIKKEPQNLKTVFFFHFRKDFIVHNTFWIPPNNSHLSYRYVIDLKEITAISQPQASPTTKQQPIQKKKIIIDAGHGGKDPGTTGIRKIHEKDVTLAVAKRLSQKLNETGRYTTVLLRTADTSMTLAQRLRNARAAKGDLFISLHADSCDGSDTRGLSVYTLSTVASDKQAEHLAKKENKADLIMGIDLQSELPEVANILIDLTKRETMNLSIKFAQCLMSKLRDRVFLLRKPHRFADFFILKSADLPSILIELGYLSNPKEALLLTSPSHQEAICAGIVEAIDSCFKTRS